MLKRPLITEKSMALSKANFYTFEIAKNVNKTQIAKLISEKYKVDVLSVKTINVKPKKRMQRTKKGIYLTRGLKKAYVQVKNGQKITLFEEASNPKEEVTVTTAEGTPVKIKEKKSILKGTKVKIESGIKKETSSKENKENVN